jgi:hypothetical protein
MSNYMGSSQEGLDFLKAIHVRDRLILELTDALQAMDDAFSHYCEGDPSDDEIAALEVARNALKKVSGEQA